MKRICIAALALGMFAVTPSWSGNKQMVEERVKELDALNKEMVSQIPDKPKSGGIKVRAKVTQREGRFRFDIYEKKITPKENGTLQFNSTQGPNEMRPATEGKFEFDAPQVNNTSVQGEKSKDENQNH